MNTTQQPPTFAPAAFASVTHCPPKGGAPALGLPGGGRNAPANLHAVEIFRAGTRVTADGRALEFGRADLDEIVESFAAANPDGVPLVIGHPQTHDEAHGWVSKLWRDGDSLFCDCADVSAALRDKIAARRLPNRSASFFPPRHPHNPTPGRWHLRHVGFLGAVAPAVSGLQPIQFAADDRHAYADFQTFEPTQDTEPVGGDDVAKHRFATKSRKPRSGDVERFIAPETSPHPTTENPDMTDQTDDLSARLTEMQAKLDAVIAERDSAREALDAATKQVAEFAAQAVENTKSQNREFVESLVRAGRLTPANRAGACAALDTLSGIADCAEFAAADGKTVQASAWLREFLGAQQVQSFAALPVADGGTQVIRTDADLDRAARAYAAEKGCDYATAAQHCIQYMQ